MNSIAGFVPGLQMRQPSDPSEPRSNSEDGVNSGNGKGNGFDTVLSGVAQNATAEPGTPPVWSPLMRASGDPATGGNGTAEASTAVAPDMAATAESQSANDAVAAGASAQAKRILPGLASSSSLLPNTGAGAASSPGGLQFLPVMLAGSAAPPLKLPSTSVAAQNGALAGGRANLNVAAANLFASGTQAAGEPITVFGTTNGFFAAASAKNADATAGQEAKQSLISSATGVAGGSPHPSGASSPAATTAGMPAAVMGALAGIVPVQAGGFAASNKSLADAMSGKRMTPALTAAASPDVAKTSDPAVGVVVPPDPLALAAVAAIVAPNRSIGVNGISMSNASKGDVVAPPTASIDGSPLLPSQSMSRLQAQVPTSAAAASGLNMTAADLAPHPVVTAVERNNAVNPAAVKVAVLSSATHFAPVAHLSPTQQIADAVIEAMPTLLPGASAPSANAVAGTGLVSTPSNPTFVIAQPAASAVKTMNLQLDPGSLGVVTVTLSLSANGLDVQMAASQAATMNIIEKDKQSLSNQLGQSGYTVAGLSVTLGAHSGANLADNRSATQGQGGQGTASGGGQTMSQGGSSNGNKSGQNPSDRSGALQNTPGQQPPNGMAAPTSRGFVSDDLYI